MNQSRRLPFILICSSVKFMFLSKDGGTYISAGNPLKIKANWAAWEKLFKCVSSHGAKVDLCIINRLRAKPNKKPLKLPASAAFGANSRQENESHSEISGDVLSSPPAPPPLPPTSHTSCTSWGRAMWRAEREKGRGRGGEKNQRRKTNQEP